MEKEWLKMADGNAYLNENEFDTVQKKMKRWIRLYKTGIFLDGILIALLIEMVASLIYFVLVYKGIVAQNDAVKKTAVIISMIILILITAVYWFIHRKNTVDQMAVGWMVGKEEPEKKNGDYTGWIQVGTMVIPVSLLKSEFRKYSQGERFILFSLNCEDYIDLIRI